MRDVGVRGVARPLCPSSPAPSVASPSAWFGVVGAERERVEALADDESFCLIFENALNAACFFDVSDSRTPVGGAVCGV